MKAYNKLTEKEQAAARKYFLDKLLANITDGYIRFSDTLNENDLQAKIDRACYQFANEAAEDWEANRMDALGL